jgi:hypothetical protein
MFIHSKIDIGHQEVCWFFGSMWSRISIDPGLFSKFSKNLVSHQYLFRESIVAIGLSITWSL